MISVKCVYFDVFRAAFLPAKFVCLFKARDIFGLKPIYSRNQSQSEGPRVSHREARRRKGKPGDAEGTKESQ